MLFVYIRHKGRMLGWATVWRRGSFATPSSSFVDDPLTEVEARKSAVTRGKIRASCVGYRWVALDGPLGMPFSDFPLLPWSSRALSLSPFPSSSSLPVPFLSLSHVFHTCTRECVLRGRWSSSKFRTLLFPIEDFGAAMPDFIRWQ